MPRTRRRANGMTLLEVMISMSILLIGLLGMMRLQIWGLSSNQGARALTVATHLAREVAAGLDRLHFDDSRLAATGTFGSLLQADGSVVSSGYTAFTGIPGVRGDETIESDSSGAVFQRRWTVSPLEDGKGAKLVAVSVIYHERGNPLPREVLVYTCRTSGASLLANIPGLD